MPTPALPAGLQLLKINRLPEFHAMHLPSVGIIGVFEVGETSCNDLIKEVRARKISGKLDWFLHVYES